ncbi:hypothetical protein BCV72DRAFT_219646 [Rhizopus microsporus var. microsporus]|uniref:Uncharacterized protein n=2 Tax=Rhizopus microsporus TaxID=58291 RepID=A0A2G4STT7_RHIZD|nr:uncharacterized protein RHIMIDRAFT_284282 [Rhizopus microsporus ATCC 52813]ORE11511.1 hypothetical protein BCV72DRAFT_219646 [Rhizopus microsporus var. microsporus]PHZ12189.1 hypothetical protein RHIMIDRAFT_284282 [Rhizopus microsporus ATCC 52813]
MISRNFAQVQKSLQVCLTLPIKVIFTNINDSFRHPANYSQMKVKDLFIYDTTSDTPQ